MIKTKLFKKIVKKIAFHRANCLIFKKFLGNNFKSSNIKSIHDLPFLPVTFFKDYEMLSIKKNQIYKILTSSGTTGSKSKIFLDKKNAKNQINVLQNLVSKIIGNQRLPMVVVDKEDVIKTNFNSARAAAISGFSLFGKEKLYLFNKKFKFKENEFKKFLKKYQNQKILMFGFTSIIYEKFLKIKKKYNLNNFILIHGGGWKNVNEKGVNNISFKKQLFKNFNLSRVINYYGMIEQTGSIFFECEKCNNLKSTEYSDIIIRDENLCIQSKGKKGIVQTISTLPSSYPGNSILTEDIGYISDVNCKECTNYTKFKILGRLEKSEVRGCSDAV